MNFMANRKKQSESSKKNETVKAIEQDVAEMKSQLMLLQAACVTLKNTAKELYEKAQLEIQLAHIKSHVISANSIMNQYDLKEKECVEFENLISEAIKKMISINRCNNVS